MKEETVLSTRGRETEGAERDEGWVLRKRKGAGKDEGWVVRKRKRGEASRKG